MFIALIKLLVSAVTVTVFLFVTFMFFWTAIGHVLWMIRRRRRK